MNLLLAISNSIAASILLKATLVLALGLILSALMRRARASLRHALLAATFAILLALPIASYFAPPIRITAAVASPAPQPQIQFIGVPITSRTPTVLFTAATAPPRPRISPTEWLLIAWLTGTILFLLPMFLGLYQVRSLRRSAAHWTRRERTQILLHPEISGPMTCGVFRPAILLPRDAESWPAGNLKRALVHELEHVRRADWLTQSIARAICSVYWFHPLAWIAWRRIVLEAECSCDDAVLANSDATAYADQLIHLARHVSGRTPMLAMANRADLGRRVHSLLDSRQRRGRAGALSVALTTAFALAIVFALSPLRIVAAPQTSPAAPPIAQAAPLPPPPPARPQPAIAQAQPPAHSETAPSVADGNYVLTIVPINAIDSRAILTSKDHFAPAPQAPPLVAQVQPQTPPPPAAPPKPPAPAPSTAQEQPPISSTTDMVVVAMTARDSNGNNVDDLKVGDVQILEDDKPQSVAVLDYQKESNPPYYMIGYYTSNQAHDSKYRRIRVKIVGRTDVRATDYREGYYSGQADLASVVTPATPIYQPLAEYSDEARRAKWTGSVLLQIVVNEKGDPTEIKVVRPLGLGLDEKAIEAVSKWKFKPAQRNGQPVPWKTEVTVAFRLL